MTIPPPGFTGAVIDRADNLRLQPERIAALAADPGARLLRLAGLDPVLDEDGRLRWDSMASAKHDVIFLGLAEGRPLFAPLLRVERAPAPSDTFRIIGLMAPEEAALWAAARSLLAWHGRHGFCANCGSATAPFRAGWGRQCAACPAEHYPRVDPVVIMLAEYHGKVLIARQPRFPPGRYSALAGFVEVGESIEEAVARELREEAALAVRNVRYVASQPWPFPSSLMIACIAEAVNDRVVLDRTELEDSIWVTREEVAAALAGDAAAPFLAPPSFAIANTLLRHWLSDPLAASGASA